MTHETSRFAYMADRARGIASGQIDPAYSTLEPEDPNGWMSHYDSHRDDIFALLANETKGIVSRAYVIKDEILEHFPEPPADASAYYLMQLRIKEALQITAMQNRSGDPVHDSLLWWDDYHTTSRKERFDPFSTPPRNAYGLLSGGINNAVQFHAGLSAVVPQVVRRELGEENVSPQLLAETLNNSKAIVLQFANTGISEFARKISGLVDSKAKKVLGGRTFPEDGKFFRPEVFKFAGDSRPRLLLHKERIPVKESDDIGCPALVKIMGISAIDKLWQWNLEESIKVFNTQEVSVERE